MGSHILLSIARDEEAENQECHQNPDGCNTSKKRQRVLRCFSFKVGSKGHCRPSSITCGLLASLKQAQRDKDFATSLWPSMKVLLWAGGPRYLLATNRNFSGLNETHGCSEGLTQRWALGKVGASWTSSLEVVGLVRLCLRSSLHFLGWSDLSVFIQTLKSSGEHPSGKLLWKEEDWALQIPVVCAASKHSAACRCQLCDKALYKTPSYF